MEEEEEEDVGGQGRLLASEVPRQLRTRPQQGGPQDQRLARGCGTIKHAIEARGP